MKKLLISLVILLFSGSILWGKPLTLNEISEAGCRIEVKANVGGSFLHDFGSGICIKEDADNIYILTNAHVLGLAEYAYVDFFRLGYPSTKMVAKVIYKARKLNTDIDFCVLSLAKSEFGQYPLPRIIPLAPKDFTPRKGFYLASAGCPEGRDLVMWQGYILTSTSSKILFTPPPQPGQSGSGLLVLIQGSNGEWYTRVGGLVTWRIKNQATDGNFVMGGGIPIARLYDVMEGQVKAEKMPTRYIPISAAASTDICKNCNRPKDEHALGSDGKLYCISIKDGKPSVVLPTGILIEKWPVQCGPKGCPTDPNFTGIFGFKRPFQQPQQPQQPQPLQPQPALPPNLPNFGEPWPGLENPTTPQPSQSIQLPNDDSVARLKEIADKYAKLQKQNQEYEDHIKDLESQLNGGLVAQTTSLIKESPWWSTIGAGLLGGIVYALWSLFGRRILARKIDSVEDLIQQKIASMWGKDSAKEVRGLLDGIDEALIGVADSFLEKRRLLSKLGKNEPINAASILQAFNDSINKQLNKTAANMLFSKEEIMDLLQTSEATEIAEKDVEGQAAIKELIAQVAKLESEIHANDVHGILEKVKVIEGKDNDKAVLDKLAALEKKIAALQPVATPAK
jgi:cell division septum initiation protein DivIVA